MKLSQDEKQKYVDAISKDIFHRPLKQLSWENLNTLYCSVIARCPNELDYPERNQLVSYIKEIRPNYERTKEDYEWMN